MIGVNGMANVTLTVSCFDQARTFMKNSCRRLQLSPRLMATKSSTASALEPPSASTVRAA